MFVFNSQQHLVTATYTRLLNECKQGFYRRYTSNLPTSLEIITLIRLRLLTLNTCVGSGYGYMIDIYLFFNADWCRLEPETAIHTFFRFSSQRTSTELYI